MEVDGLQQQQPAIEVNMNKRLVRQKEAAEYLHLSEATMERDRWRGGDIPYIRIGPRAIRYDLEQLDEYIDRNTVKNVSETI